MVDPPSGQCFTGDNARITKHPKVFADLWLTNTERVGDLADRQWTDSQQLDNPQASRLAERPEDSRLHIATLDQRRIPVKEYFVLCVA